MKVKVCPVAANIDQMETRRLTVAECFGKSTVSYVSWDCCYWWQPGCTLIIWRQRCSHQNGIQHPLLDQKKSDVKPKIKVMLIVFFLNKIVVHYDFVPAGQIMNSPLYVQVLKRLREAILRKCSPNGKKDGHFITTMFFLTYQLLCR